MEEEANKTAR